MRGLVGGDCFVVFFYGLFFCMSWVCWFFFFLFVLGRSCWESVGGCG